MIKVHFANSYSSGSWEIYAMEYTQTGRVPYRISIERLKEVGEMEKSDPAIRVPYWIFDKILPAVLEGLVEANLMPKMGAVEAELKATVRHLKDMRSLVFKTVSPEVIK